ncbi:hypothetical protein CWO85_02775 [Candidatus Phytoplasma ziziphi]|uniref:Uncharacterized protein n=1 Tax=Ziziphus jujuba witches'-broom phytoplasma TaxID=135727 RepID=A0A660HN49_ZIZJU|nr:hypothetical protein [Candidatus Phytoplasma ziziphi]AYJ01412.1 hypothetical protein CWO85_02775 [Candidatus Phytoplasma ziziphi]
MKYRVGLATKIGCVLCIIPSCVLCIIFGLGIPFVILFLNVFNGKVRKDTKMLAGILGLVFFGFLIPLASVCGSEVTQETEISSGIFSLCFGIFPGILILIGKYKKIKKKLVN